MERRRLVDAGIAEEEMRLPLGRRVAVHRFEDPAELAAPAPVIQFADDGARPHVRRRESERAAP